jgi:SAM-dependent methyltransferase
VTQNGYTGTDNLEVMAEALNYNRFLIGLVLKANPHGQPMLDFGAGVGTFAKALTERGLQVDCVEPDNAQADAIDRSGLRVFRNTESVPSGHYDFAYSFNVLEHIEDDLHALTELHRILRPDGVLLIYVPAFRIEDVRHADSLGFPASLLFKLFGSDSGQISKRSVLLYDRKLFPLSAALDRLLSPWIGKNLVLIARK